jgi:hypothetical protein
MDDDLHGGVVVIDQGVEAFVHQVLKRDPPGDEGVACEKVKYPTLRFCRPS